MTISNENINDLMVTALEGGINYWAEKVTFEIIPKGIKKNVEIIASELISKGGTLRVHDMESNDSWLLDKEKFLKGLEKTLEWGGFDDIEDLIDSHDAETADVLIQYALFDEIVFG